MAAAGQQMAKCNSIWAFNGQPTDRPTERPTDGLGQHLCKFYTSTQRIARDSVKHMYVLVCVCVKV